MISCACKTTIKGSSLISSPDLPCVILRVEALCHPRAWPKDLYCVIPRPDQRISSALCHCPAWPDNLYKNPALRVLCHPPTWSGDLIKSPSLLKFRHCEEWVKRTTKQSLRILYKKFKWILNSPLCHPPAWPDNLYKNPPTCVFCHHPAWLGDLITINSKFIHHCEEAKRPKQSLGILDFYPRNSKFPTMSSPSLTGGSLFCDEIPRSSRGMTQGLGNSRIPTLNSRIPKRELKKNSRIPKKNSKIHTKF